MMIFYVSRLSWIFSGWMMPSWGWPIVLHKKLNCLFWQDIKEWQIYWRSEMKCRSDSSLCHSHEQYSSICQQYIAPKHWYDLYFLGQSYLLWSCEHFDYKCTEKHWDWIISQFCINGHRCCNLRAPFTHFYLHCHWIVWGWHDFYQVFTVCCAHLGRIYLIKKYAFIIFYGNFNIFWSVIHSCDEFSAVMLFQSSGSQDPSEIILIHWFGTWETLSLSSI